MIVNCAFSMLCIYICLFSLQLLLTAFNSNFLKELSLVNINIRLLLYTLNILDFYDCVLEYFRKKIIQNLVFVIVFYVEDKGYTKMAAFAVVRNSVINLWHISVICFQIQTFPPLIHLLINIALVWHLTNAFVNDMVSSW